MPEASPAGCRGWQATNPSERPWRRGLGCRASRSGGSQWSSHTFACTECWANNRGSELRTADQPEVRPDAPWIQVSRAPRLHLLVVSYPCSTAINQDFFAHVDEETGCFSMSSAH